jgi:hypothetical protein
VKAASVDDVTKSTHILWAQVFTRIEPGGVWHWVCRGNIGLLLAAEIVYSDRHKTTGNFIFGILARKNCVLETFIWEISGNIHLSTGLGKVITTHESDMGNIGILRS